MYIRQKGLSSDANRQELGRYNILNEMQNSARKINNKAYNFNVTLDWGGNQRS
ncbi:MAG: hypothetical protein V8S95_12410 [Odoribacter sp.]